jgi:PAS domain S-box-containing protein
MAISSVPLSLFKHISGYFDHQLEVIDCTKVTLIQLSHALEELVLDEQHPALVFAAFQNRTYWRTQIERWRALSVGLHYVYVFAPGQLLSDAYADLVHIPLPAEDPLYNEWMLCMVTTRFCLALCAHPHESGAGQLDQEQRFHALWSFDPTVVSEVLTRLEHVVERYSPHRLAQLHVLRQELPLVAPDPALIARFTYRLAQSYQSLHDRSSLANRRRIVDALWEREQQLDAIAANLPGMCYRIIWRDNGDITLSYLSDGFRELTGLDPEEVMRTPKRWLDLVHPDDRLHFLRTRRNSAGVLEPYETEYRMTNAAGDIIWIRSTARPHLSEDGAVVWDGIALDVTANKQTEAQLRALVREKEALLKESYHRVKNNLQIITSLLDLQADSAHHPQALDSFRVTQHRVRAMALLHDKLYQSPDLTRIDLGSYVHALCENLTQVYQAGNPDIDVIIDINDVYLNIDVAIPCGLILNELVANALKHAFPGGAGGTVFVTFQTLDTAQATLSVMDTGVGLPNDFQLQRVETLGLQLVIMLARQLKGAITLVDQSGTHATLTFPLASNRRKDSGDADTNSRS